MTWTSDPVEREKRRLQSARWKPQAGGQAAKRMEAFLEQLRLGKSVNAATAAVGVSTHAYDKWKLRVPGFAEEVTRIRQRLASGTYPTHPFDAAFRARYFGLSTPKHMQAALDLINGLEGGQAGLIQLPPAHGKTSLMEDYICHQVAHNPDVRVIVVSRSERHAKKVLSKIKWRLTDRSRYDEFLWDYGPFRGETRDGRSWTTQAITVARASGVERDYTVAALGVGGQLYGSRSDLIVLDDIQDPDNATQAQTEDMLEWIEQVVITRIGSQGRLLVVGTRVREGDVYAELEERNFFDNVLRLPAIIREPESEDDPGEVLWPEQWPYERLVSRFRQKMDPRRFALVFQQEEIPGEGAVFPLESIESCYDPMRYVGHIPEGTRVVVGIDPAATHFTAGVVVAVDPTNKRRYLVDVWNKKNLTGDGGDRLMGLVQFIVELCDLYNADACCIEVNNMQTLLTQSLTLRTRLTDLGVRLLTHQSGRGENDDLAIAQLSALFTNGLISIPAMGDSKARLREFVRQFAVWRPGDKKLVRDVVKATQFAERAARNVLSLYASSADPIYTDPRWEPPPYLRPKQVTVITDPKTGEQRPATRGELARGLG